MDWEDYIGWFIGALIVGLFVLLGFAIWGEATDPHIQLNKTEWHCSHSHTIYQPILVGKTATVIPEDICDTYRMNGYE